MPLSCPRRLWPGGQRTYRSIAIEGQEVEFSEGFTDLHTEVYRRTLAGEGFGLKEARPGIELTARVRRAEVVASRPEVRHAYLG